MPDLLRLARTLRSDTADPGQIFTHRIRVGILVATLILIFSLLR